MQALSALIDRTLLATLAVVKGAGEAQAAMQALLDATEQGARVAQAIASLIMEGLGLSAYEEWVQHTLGTAHSFTM